MRDIFIEDSRYRKLKNVSVEVSESSSNVPKTIVVVAPVGTGKTTLVRRLAIELEWVYFAVREYMSAGWLFGELAYELGRPRERSLEQNYRAIISALRENPCGLVFDEAHRYVHHLSRFDAVRDVCDEVGVPLLLCGTAELLRAVHALPALESRVSGWCTIEPCTLADARLYAAQLCEVELADDLVKYMHEITAGSARGMVLALSRLEALGRRRGKKSLRLSDIPARFSFTYLTRNRRHAAAAAADTDVPTTTGEPTLKMVI